MEAGGPEKLLHIVNNQVEFGWFLKFFSERFQNFENFFILFQVLTHKMATAVSLLCVKKEVVIL